MGTPHDPDLAASCSARPPRDGFEPLPPDCPAVVFAAPTGHCLHCHPRGVSVGAFVLFIDGAAVGEP
jgi:hypothetical protein